MRGPCNRKDADNVNIENPRDVPEQWRPFFEKKAIDFTFRALERKTGVAANTIIRALNGEKKTTARVVTALCEALGISTETFYEMQGKPVVEPFVLPARASQLTTREREVVRDVVHALLDAHEQASAKSDAPPEGDKDKEANRSRRRPPPKESEINPPLNPGWDPLDPPGVSGDEDGEEGHEFGTG